MLTSRHLGAIRTEYSQISRGDVAVDLNIENLNAITQATLDEVDRTIDAIDTLRATALASFTTALADDNTQTAKFWQFHHDEVDPALERDQFVAALRLGRVGLYPYGSTYVVLDFSVRGPQTDQLLVANFNRDHSLHHVSWES